MHPADAAPEYFSRQIAEAKRFYREPMPTDAAPLTVVAGGREHCAPDYAVRRDSFPYLALEFVAQGRGQLVLAGNTWPLSAGACFTYGPGLAHEIVSEPAAPLVKYFVDFSGARAADLLAECGLPAGTAVQTMAASGILAVFDDLIRHGLMATPLSARITATCLELLVLKIAAAAIPFGLSGSPALATYRRCLHFIEENWRTLDTLQQIAEACHIDPAYLCRLFRKFHQPSPYQLLLRHKIQAAAAQLLLPDASIKKIADDLHFSDAFHFSRVFKKHMGHSPSAFIRHTAR